jgi:hypothetical protein
MYSADARIGVFCRHDAVVTTSKPRVYLCTHCLQYKTICDIVTFNIAINGNILTRYATVCDNTKVIYDVVSAVLRN